MGLSDIVCAVLPSAEKVPDFPSPGCDAPFQGWRVSRETWARSGLRSESCAGTPGWDPKGVGYIKKLGCLSASGELANIICTDLRDTSRNAADCNPTSYRPCPPVPQPLRTRTDFERTMESSTFDFIVVGGKN